MVMAGYDDIPFAIIPLHLSGDDDDDGDESTVESTSISVSMTSSSVSGPSAIASPGLRDAEVVVWMGDFNYR